MSEWEKIEPGLLPVVKFEAEGDSVEGILIAKKENIGANNSKAYVLELPNKEFKHVWGTTVLDNKMQLIKEGDRVRIIYRGIQKNAKKQDTKIFEVLRFKE